MRLDHSGTQDIFITSRTSRNGWCVIPLRASPPSERPDGLPADFMGIIHETVGSSIPLLLWVSAI